MVPDQVYRLCHRDETVSSELAKDPSQSPAKVFHKLYHGHRLKDKVAAAKTRQATGDRHDGLQKAYECGKWGTTRPSQLFLKIYHDALCTLEKNPMAAVVSPPLMGSHGVVPLTIVAPLPDLCRHIANCIVRAETEVFLGTNFWIYSDASTLVTDAFRELSRRAGERGTKVVVKVLYDRGNVQQVWDNHLSVPEKVYADPSGKVRLPPASEIPNIDMQVVNYHRPIFGTFHAKFMVIDRRVALIQSSNVQDNDNLEMLVRVEGPIVDSFYDTALISWGKTLDPPLPMLSSPAADAAIPSFSSQQPQTDSDKERRPLLPEHTTQDPHYDPDIQQEAQRVNDTVRPREGEAKTRAVTRHLNTTIQQDTTGDVPDSDQEPPMRPYVTLPPHKTFPMALVNREPWGAPNHSSVYTPQNAAFLSALKHAKHSIFIQTPNMNAEPILAALLAAVRRGVTATVYLCLGYNDAGQLLPFQNGTNEMIANRLYRALHTAEERARLRIHNYVGKDQTKPIHNKFKQRSCHIKLMIVDEQVAIQGNGNLDTQSFYHSQEVNLLLDSPLVCRAWLDQINQNQNTALYGAVSPEDGCWHDPVTGKLPRGSVGVDPGRFTICVPPSNPSQTPPQHPPPPMARPYEKYIVDITHYVFHYTIDDETAWSAARVALLDAMGCAIETLATSDECRKLLGPPVPGTMVPHGFKLPGTEYCLDPVKGAFDMGALIRYLDHNDALGGAEWGHPSDNLGAILPVMDWLCRASAAGAYTHTGPPLTMRTLLTALTKAYEIQGCYQMQNAFNAFGIDHVVLVKLASAAVVAWLLGLTQAQTMATISHVWMDGHPSRVYRARNSTIPRKGWAAGDAGMRAVHLALLVRAGQPGVSEPLGSAPWGFYARTFGPKGFELPRPFGVWTVRNVLFKLMPVEGHGIAAVEAALVQLGRLRAGRLGPEHVARIDVRTTQAADLIINKTGPLYNAADRDHCIQYVVALAFLKGMAPEAGDYRDNSGWATSEDLASLRDKIAIQVDEQLTKDYLDLDKKSVGSGLTVHLQDGSVLPEVLVEYPVGHVRNPATGRGVREKFMTNMHLMFSEDEITKILEAVENDTLSVMEFVDLFSRRSATASRL
ncbi:MmgE/PrpD family protein [Aspergillus clavatus NRRL 1]|uniref:MmgE/PrpD family protein n=1 Tax=Aspergillus clavatus (strain ATCC 1007 / CBS 513.65 / DSM 816 / NCTC 3887 / NRRL 1 / QM 1276 / 107) TaxID=344612 RepID=A1C726_ASPCL|nr:MmgE/PrpD family protein [Aspergillus clavatus NRRL 1]EAW14197.1 MmgE/PrpD family protein [Aspergillus clavatus NRRL 1]